MSDNHIMDLFSDQQILGFFGEYRFLSNFWPCLVEYDGELYASVEHAYQAAKFTDPAIRERIRRTTSPGRAKRAGRLYTVRDDWDAVRVVVMHDLLIQKFRNHEFLRDSLLATGNAYLEETNTWNDRFWGVCNGTGTNMLGRLLMGLREDLRTEMAK